MLTYWLILTSTWWRDFVRRFFRTTSMHLNRVPNFTTLCGSYSAVITLRWLWLLPEGLQRLRQGRLHLVLLPYYSEVMTSCCWYQQRRDWRRGTSPTWRGCLQIMKTSRQNSMSKYYSPMKPNLPPDAVIGNFTY